MAADTAPDLVFNFNPEPTASPEQGEDARSDGEAVPTAPVAPSSAERPAEERIADLFEHLPARRRVLLGLLDFTREPRSAADFNAQTDRLQQYDRSVYSGPDYAVMLEGAGAIEKTDADGGAFDENAEAQPDVVVVEGREYYRPVDGLTVYWKATPEGIAYLEADDPFGRFLEMMESESAYGGIFARVLELCAEPGGKTVKQIGGQIDQDPLLQSPRRYAPYFIGKLEDCGALKWEGSWTRTDVGAKCLDYLNSNQHGSVKPGDAEPSETEE